MNSGRRLPPSVLRRSRSPSRRTTSGGTPPRGTSPRRTPPRRTTSEQTPTGAQPGPSSAGPAADDSQTDNAAATVLLGPIGPDEVRRYGPYALTLGGFNSGTAGRIYEATHVDRSELWVAKVGDSQSRHIRRNAYCEALVMLLMQTCWPGNGGVLWCRGLFQVDSQPMYLPKLPVDPVEGPLTSVLVVERAGADLFEVTKEEQNMPGKEVLALLKSMFHVLDRAYKTFGIVHRDVKPENIFLSPLEEQTQTGEKRLRVVLADWGQAMLTTDGRVPHSMIHGTPSYCGPELVRDPGDQLTKAFWEGASTYDGHKADIWALGCACYFAATSRFPFQHYMTTLDGDPSRGVPRLGGMTGTERQFQWEEGVDDATKQAATKSRWHWRSSRIKHEGLRNIIKRMLTLDPRARPSSEQLLADEVFLALDDPRVECAKLDPCRRFHSRVKPVQVVTSFEALEVQLCTMFPPNTTRSLYDDLGKCLMQMQEEGADAAKGNDETQDDEDEGQTATWRVENAINALLNGKYDMDQLNMDDDKKYMGTTYTHFRRVV